MVLHPTEEQLPVDGSIHNQWGSQARRAKSCKERRRLPVTVGNTGQHSLAFWRPSSRASHIRFGPRFVDEDEPIRIEERLLPLQLFPPLRDVRPLPLRGDKDFFLTVRPSRFSAAQSVGTDSSVCSSAFSSRSVRSGFC